MDLGCSFLVDTYSIALGMECFLEGQGMTMRRSLLILRFIDITVAVLVQQACSSATPATSTVVAIPTLLPTSESVPYYLEKVFPAPGSTVQVGDHDTDFGRQRGLCVRFLAHRILEPGDDLHLRDISDRTGLKVNGKFVEVLETRDHLMEFETAAGARSTGPYDICGTIELSPGDYIASFVVHKTSGEELEYSWWFRVVE